MPDGKPGAPGGGKKASVAVDEHKLPLDEVLARYSTKVDEQKPATSPGLTTDEAARRLAADGPNVMSPPKTVHPAIKFFGFLLALFNFLLILAGVFTFILYGIEPAENQSALYIGPILFGVAIANATLEFVQAQKSEAAMRAFLNMIPAKATAMRNGQLVSVAAPDLVKGDVVFVRMGDKIPADIRLFKTQDMKVDNSCLTGESEPQDRQPVSTHDNALEAQNLAFNSSLVVAGEGYGIVIRTGDDTVIGQIANMTSSEKKRMSPLTEEIESFVHLIGAVAISTAIIFFVVDLLLTDNLSSAFGFGVGVLVAWVPQGLPSTVTMLLTIAAKRMASQNVLVKDLTGVETLGAMTLLATDKTGTLTRNQMTVSIVWTHFKKYVLGDARSLQEDEVVFDSSVKGVAEVLNMSALCSRARFNKTDVPMDQREIIGDATETGLYRLATQKIRDFDTLADRFPKVLDLPFNSDTKWAMTIHQLAHPTGVYTQYIKGAPERVLRICSHIVSEDGSIIPLTDEHKAAFNEAYEYMASKGHRVLAFAKNELAAAEYPQGHAFSKDAKNFPMTGLTFVGLASLEDPPKHGVREAVGNCRRAGVKVVMVTGDHPLTAEAIGRKINIMINDTKPKMAKKLGVPESEVKEEDVKAIVIHGEKIDSLTPEDWDIIFSKDEIIFARTSPKNKLQIVKYAQSLGHIVGVTGDGVNDSPALKKADLGIAMNISGSDVSKEAAAMILLDDNFASIVNGIREGRLIFMNLKKSIKYVLTHIVPEVIPQLLFVAVPLPVALGALQILAIDLGFEVFMALTYAYEPPESEGLMKLTPRRPVDHDSIERLRARRAFYQRHMIRAGAVDDGNAPSAEEDLDRPLTVRERLGMWTSGEYWSKWAFAGEDGEVLVDGNVISWAYLESGVIQFVVGYIAFFVVFYAYQTVGGNTPLFITPTDVYNCARLHRANKVSWGGMECPLGNGLVFTKLDQEQALREAQTVYYLSILIIQIGNLFACKVSITSPLRSFVFKNTATYKGIVAGLLLGGLIAYVPGLSEAFGCSNRLNPLYLLIPLGGAILTVLYAALRHYIKMRFSPVKFTPEPLGLAMHATRYSQA